MKSMYLWCGLVLVACAGAEKPPEAPAATSAPSASPAESAAPAPSASAAPETAAPAPSASAAPPPPTLTASGNLGDKPFVPVSASLGAVLPGNLAAVTFRSFDRPCAGWKDDGDARQLQVILPWKEGGSVDLATKVMLDWGKVKRPEAAASASLEVWTKLAKPQGPMRDKQEWKPIAGFKPTGTATWVKGPGGDSAGRLKLDLKSGSFTVSGEITVSNCSKLTPQ